MRVLETVVPLFLVILSGHVVRRTGLFDDHLIQRLNRFVFLFPLPLLIFTGVVQSRLADVAPAHVLIVVLPTAVVFGLALAGGLAARMRGGRLGSFVQTTFHGNISYIGLAVLFYLLGDDGLRRGSLLVGFLILVNNTLAVAVLCWASPERKGALAMLASVLKSPVVAATLIGLAFLYLGLSVPAMLMKTMGMVSNIALPMALILIGGSISPANLRTGFKLSALASVLKLLVLPALAILYCWLVGIPHADALPAILLLATPVAASSYTMARELGGDSEIASGAVTLSTLLSPLAFAWWAAILG